MNKLFVIFPFIDFAIISFKIISYVTEPFTEPVENKTIIIFLNYFLLNFRHLYSVLVLEREGRRSGDGCSIRD